MNNQQWSQDDHEKHWNLDKIECHLLTEPDSCLPELFHEYLLSFLSLVNEDQLLTNNWHQTIQEWKSQLTCGIYCNTMHVSGGWSRDDQSKLIKTKTSSSLQSKATWPKPALRWCRWKIHFRHQRELSWEQRVLLACFKLGFAHIAIITQVKTHNRLCSCS